VCTYVSTIIPPFSTFDSIFDIFGRQKFQKNSNFGQNLNFSEKSEKNTENQKPWYESIVQVSAISGHFGPLNRGANFCPETLKPECAKFRQHFSTSYHRLTGTLVHIIGSQEWFNRQVHKHDSILIHSK
jgi:hypothetical protein